MNKLVNIPEYEPREETSTSESTPSKESPSIPSRETPSTPPPPSSPPSDTPSASSETLQNDQKEPTEKSVTPTVGFELKAETLLSPLQQPIQPIDNPTASEAVELRNPKQREKRFNEVYKRLSSNYFISRDF